VVRAPQPPPAGAPAARTLRRAGIPAAGCLPGG